ncbi:MAG: alkyl hydroperoxide reductase [Cytophagaceae bacterium]|jgi:hypothetical protein|nr:alkyl hydroperoxide reductase [Cytophagaceae bacterium]
MAASWKKYLLKAAGVYNVVWGMWVLFFPQSFFSLCGIPLINYPEIWQSVGMIVGVYGIGYWIAGDQPDQQWPLLLVGFLGKLFGPIGALWNIAQGKLEPCFFWINVFNDLIWLPFFFIILLHTYRKNKQP